MNLLFADKDIATIENVINKKTKELVDRSRAKKLSIIEYKIKLIFFGSMWQYHHSINNIKLDKISLIPVILAKKLSRNNGILSKLRNFNPLHTLANIYYEPFHSYIIYASVDASNFSRYLPQ